MDCKQIISKLEELSPLIYACDWDNSGLLVGQVNKEVSTICIALDGTDQVIEEAIQQKADLLILHHPLIMKGMKRITNEDFIGRKIIKLIQHNITCYAMHTNFDVMGMADAAASIIGIKESKILSVSYDDENSQQGCGRFGKLPKEMTLIEYADFIKEKFQIESIRIYGNTDKIIKTVAIVPGSGADMIKDALKEKVDLLITGDIKHHDGLDSYEQGLIIMDAGHFGLEKLFVSYINNYLKREFPQVKLQIPNQTCPFWIR